MTLSNAVTVLENSRTGLGHDAQAALDLLAEELDRHEQLSLELLRQVRPTEAHHRPAPRTVPQRRRRVPTGAP